MILSGLIIILFLIVWSKFKRKQKNNELELKIKRMKRLLQLIAYRTGINLDLDHLEFIQQEKIEAINRAREVYRYGLKEAKNYLEHIERIRFHLS
jgi:hypothetical protein